MKFYCRIGKPGTGGVKSSADSLSFPENGKYGKLKNKRIATDLNGGGATVRVVTTNGKIKIGNETKKSEGNVNLDD